MDPQQGLGVPSASPHTRHSSNQAYASDIRSSLQHDQDLRADRPERHNVKFRKVLQGTNDTLRICEEFYIPVQSSSIRSRKKLCVACVNGFEIIDPDMLDTQEFLHPSDESLDFVRRRNHNTHPKPVEIYQIENEFLLCHDSACPKFAFYINRGGRMSRKNFLVHWEGAPTSFAFQNPYVLAFEPTFVEIRKVETGSMSQVIQGNNLCLFTDMPPSLHHAYPRMSHRHSSLSLHNGSPDPGPMAPDSRNPDNFLHRCLLVSSSSLCRRRMDGAWVA